MLEIFPQSLAYSIIASVYIGFLFSFLLNETFGWPASGLVVPGYLAPILVIAPISGALVVIEGILTYLLIRLVSDGLARLGLWTRFFGRDRFFALLLGSVLVRTVVEGLIIHQYGDLLAQSLGLPFESLRRFYGIGFVCSALLANALWKPGIRRGLGGVATLVGATYLTVRFVLIPVSNFSVIRLDLIYEDLAINFLASPRAYIFLLIGAALSSRLNRRLGFATGGILVPPLLALTITSPIKLGITLVEVVLVVWLARWVLRWPILAGRSVEGARRLLLAFTLAFGLRLLEGWALDLFRIPVTGTELTAFGYMITSLLAVQIMNRDSATLVLRPLLEVMAATFVLGTLACLGMPQVRGWLQVPEARPAVRSVLESGDWSTAYLVAHQPLLQRSVPPEPAPLPDDLARFTRGLESILTWTGHESQEEQAAALAHLSRLGYRVRRLGDSPGEFQLLLAPDGDAPRGHRRWGTFILAPTSPSSIALEVPHPEEPLTIEAALALHRRIGTRILAVAPARSRLNQDLRWGGDRLPRPLQAVLQTGGINLRVEIRSSPDRGSSIEGPGPAVQPLESLADRELELRLALLAPEAGRGREPARCRLRLDQQDRIGLLESPTVEATAASPESRLLDWLAEVPGAARETGSAEGRLRYARRWVVQPLLDLTREPPGDDRNDRLAELRHHANLLDTRLEILESPSGASHLLLLPRGPGPALDLDLGEPEPILLEVSPGAGDEGLVRAALALARPLRPRAILIDRRGSGTSRHPRTLLQLLHQGLALRLGREGLTLQLRSIPELTGLGEREVVYSGLDTSASALPRLLPALERLGLHFSAAADRPETAHLVGSSTQKELARFTGLPIGCLYLPPSVRRLFSDSYSRSLEALDPDLLDLESQPGSLQAVLGTRPAIRPELPPAFRPVLAPLLRFLNTANPWLLAELTDRAEGIDHRVSLLRDRERSAAYLLIRPSPPDPGAPWLVVRVDAATAPARTSLPPPSDSLERFLEAREELLVVIPGGRR